MKGPCAKTTVVCTIMAVDGTAYVGTNVCLNPQPVCPRLPGEDYTKCKTVCQQVGHAEEVAANMAGDAVRSATAVVEGHTYACQQCQERLFGDGLYALRVVPFKSPRSPQNE